MEVAIKGRRRGIDGEGPQHLAGIIPERGADLGEDDIALLTRRVEGNCRGTWQSGLAIEVVPMKWMTLIPP